MRKSEVDTSPIDNLSKISKLMVEIEEIPHTLCESYCSNKWFGYRRDNCEENICIGILGFLWAITNYIEKKTNPTSDELELVQLIYKIKNKLHLNIEERPPVFKFIAPLNDSNNFINWLNYSVVDDTAVQAEIIEDLTKLKGILENINEKQYAVISKLLLQEFVSDKQRKTKRKTSEEIKNTFLKYLQDFEDRQNIENANNHKDYCEFNKFNCWSFGKLRPNKCKKDCGIHLKNFRKKHEFGDNLLNIRVGGVRRTTKKSRRKKSRKL